MTEARYAPASSLVPAQAQAIGRMKIDRFAPVTTSRVRLHIVSSSNAVHIREFQLFDTGKGAAAAR